MQRYVLVIALLTLCVPAVLCGDDAGSIRLETPKGWTGETIKLPPSFAPDMKLKGTEVIRFAPGMFDPTSDSFFSYIFVFQVEAKPALTKEFVQSELLTYYRGLAVAVLKSKKTEVDAVKFSLGLSKVKEAELDDGTPTNATRYTGDLKWVEPFSTQKSQTLKFEVDTISEKSNWMVVCVSPQKQDAEVWGQLRAIRTGFYKNRGE